MKKLTVLGAIAALCLASCTKPLEELQPTFTSITAGESVSVSSGETANVAFKLNDVRGNKIKATVDYKSAETYDISVTFADNMESGQISVKAPESIYNDTAFDVKVKFTDAANSRNGEATFSVKPEKVAGFAEYTAHANCFVAAPGAVAKFPLYKGNSNDKVTPESLVLSWQDNKELFVDVPVLNNDEAYAVVRFAEGKEGNAVLNAVSGGAVVWSWHFWVVADTPKDVTVGAFTFQDRNVGALNLDEKNELSVGVIYQYGRKDPFPGLKFTEYALRNAYDAKGEAVAFPIVKTTEADNIDNAVKNPTTYYNNVYVSGAKHGYSWITTDCTVFGAEKFKALWQNGGKKSVYDPCPAGYKVASTEAWTAVKASTDIKELWDSAYETFDDSAIGTNAKYAVGNKKKVQFRGCIYSGLRLTITGEVNSNSTVFSFANCVGKALPTAVVWCSDIDPDFEAKVNASYFRGCTSKVNTSGNGNYDDISAIKVNALATGKFTLNYAVPVRCIKE